MTDDNVVQLHEAPSLFDNESDLYFDVYERPIQFTGSGNYEMGAYDISDKKAIVRVLDNKPVCIGVVGQNYKVLRTRELCESIEQTFMDTIDDDKLIGVKRSDRVSYNGGTCIRDYVFPNISADIGSGKSDIAFRTIVINGYDGTSSFKLYSGAIDFFCENGMVSGTYDLMVRRHTSGLRIPNLADRVKRSVEVFYQNAEKWKHWVGKEISDEDAEICFGALNSSGRFVDKMMRQFHIECMSHGRTVWALYSAATFYATHNSGEFKIRETEHDHSASTLVKRESSVMKWMQSKEFEKIAA